ncbi:MAG: FkbM family methyltransferase [Planctomycetia bacterium]|nr:FkbM family methyltransferase [Planctomycetia bacterium]
MRRRIELIRLRYTARFTRTTTCVLGPKLTIADAAAFLCSFHEIFQQELYCFHSTNPSPLIIDGGANIGLGVLYFCRLYPRSRIIAFEPDPALFAMLERNVRTFGLDGVDTRNEALWVSTGIQSFQSEGAEAGRLTRTGDQTTHSVPCVRLRDYLRDPVDLLKLDIEGAETDVLLDCRDLLHNVRNIFVEYHSFDQERQRIQELLAALIGAGFRLQMQPVRSIAKPLVQRDLLLGMDMQVNIFGFRDSAGLNKRSA